MSIEVFLYMCEDCGTCICKSKDYQSSSYNNYCAGCKQGSFFKKVVIRQTFDEYYTFVLEEKRNDSKEEGKVDVDRSVD